MDYEIVVGLEVHVELCTDAKVFCGCKNNFGDEVNTNCCPICLGMPGALPVLNEAVVDYAIRAGLALDCAINPVSKFDRKNYFYPDLSKGYQISQFDIPICENGHIDILDSETKQEKRIGITRIHIEEDTGKLIHDESFDGTLIDFNRCGVPLIEIVSEPDIRSASEAKAFLDTLKAILVCVGVTDGKMQEGSIRCDVNVSVRPKGSDTFGTRCEMKNVSTFNGTVRAIEYEANRQIEIIKNGGTILQETRRWDDMQGISVLLRSKEDAHDYRYFPEPDLLTLVVDEARIAKIRENLPELPHEKTARFMQEYDLPHFDANLLVENPDKAAFFEECVAIGTCKPKPIANWLLGDVSRLLNEQRLQLEDTCLTPKKLCEMVALVESDAISSAGGKTVIEIIMFEEKTAEEVVKEKGLKQISDTSALQTLAQEVLQEHAAAVEQYKSGKTNVLGFLVGQCMKKSAGQGNPAVLRDILLSFLNA